MRAKTILGVTTFASLLAACPDREISKVVPEQGRVEIKDIPVNPNRNVDILFVIDDSKSMEDKQANLAANFPNFINVLNTIEGGLPDVHIGVATSDMGAKSSTEATPLSGVPGCTGSGKNGALQTSGAAITTNNFISDIRSSTGTTRVQNYTGALASVFGQMAVVGTDGCGFEQHLAGMKQALSGANPGFLRKEAYLAVIFIADEDDCSISKTSLLGPTNGTLGSQQSFRCTRFGVTCDTNGATPGEMDKVGTKAKCHSNEASDYLEKVQTYVEFLKGLKEDDKMVIVAGIMGPTEPVQVEMRPPSTGGGPEQALARSCTYTGANGLEVADPPVRLKTFLDQFPDRSTFTSICQQNLSDGLQLIAQLLKDVIGSYCITGDLMDVDAQASGDQFDCSVSDVYNVNKEDEIETIVPACDATSSVKPCWRIAPDPDHCATSPHMRALVIDRSVTPPADAHVRANCVTEAT